MSIKKKPITQRTLNAMETKNSLMETALRLFAEHGYDRVTVDDITGTAGVSKGTFYNHFETKESVLVEQFHKIDQYYDSVFAEIGEDAPAAEQLRVLIDAMTHYCADICGVEVMRVVYASQISTSSTISILNNRSRSIYRYLRRIVAAGRASGEISTNVEDEILVEILMRSCRSLIYDWCLNGGEFDLHEEGRSYFGILLSWLGAEKLEKQRNAAKENACGIDTGTAHGAISVSCGTSC